MLQESPVHCTRFIGLASVDNEEKAKFLYAFNVTPMKSLSGKELTEQPPNASEFPYAESIRNLMNKRTAAKRNQQQPGVNQYFFNSDPSNDDHSNAGRGRHGGNKRRSA